ncbi:MAG: ABC transporter permease [bacterium]|nr:ABC transporter permease [bacterium]
MGGRVLIAYMVRNLLRRPWSSVMTLVGIGVVVFAVVLMLMLARGLFVRVRETGDPRNVVVISKTGQSIVLSALFDEDVALLLELEGIAKDASGRVLISPELVQLLYAEVPEARQPNGAPITVRGIRPIAMEVHRAVEVVQGRIPLYANEVMVGSLAHVKLGVSEEEMRVGSVIRFEGMEWRVCGVFSARGSLYESELWVRESDLMAAMERGTHSCATVRCSSIAAAEAAILAFERPGALQRTFTAWQEPAYYRMYAEALRWILWLTWGFVVAIGAAGVLIGMNTMYTNVIARRSEIGTLRVLGFGRGTIGVLLVGEAMMLSLGGGLAGMGLGRLLHAVPLAVAQGAFFLCFDRTVALAAFGLATMIGIVGTVVPAFRVLHGGILENLRD